MVIDLCLLTGIPTEEAVGGDARGLRGQAFCTRELWLLQTADMQEALVDSMLWTGAAPKP